MKEDLENLKLMFINRMSLAKKGQEMNLKNGNDLMDMFYKGQLNAYEFVTDVIEICLKYPVK